MDNASQKIALLASRLQTVRVRGSSVVSPLRSLIAALVYARYVTSCLIRDMHTYGLGVVNVTILASTSIIPLTSRLITGRVQVFDYSLTLNREVRCEMHADVWFSLICLSRCPSYGYQNGLSPRCSFACRGTRRYSMYPYYYIVSWTFADLPPK